MIRFLKRRLAIAEKANGGDGRWVDHLPKILLDYNRKTIAGTKVRRSSVNQNNYLTLAGQLYNSTDPTMLFNMAESFRAPSGLARLLWRYAVGDKVLLSRRVDYDIKDKGYFEKPSVVGTFGPKVYTVTACRTKLSGDLFLCPVYELSDLTGVFYESELSPALFADRDGRRREPADEPRPERRRQAAEASRKRPRGDADEPPAAGKRRRRGRRD